MLATVGYEKANLGKKKSRRTKEDFKDKEIENLYETRENSLIFIRFCNSYTIQDFFHTKILRKSTPIS